MTELPSVFLQIYNTTQQMDKDPLSSAVALSVGDLP